MATHIVPSRNWTSTLADLIEVAAPGDTIVVASENAKELAEGAAARMRPGVEIKFEVADQGRR